MERLQAKNVRMASVLSEVNSEKKQMASTVMQATTLLSKVKAEIVETRDELTALREMAVFTQGPMISAVLHKLVRTKAFGDYISACADALNLAATTDAIKLISLDHPELDIKKPMYGYDEEAREKAGWLQAEAMVNLPILPLIDELERMNHMLSAEEVMQVEVNEDIMFRESGCFVKNSFDH